jgi:hypothetical protein
MKIKLSYFLLMLLCSQMIIGQQKIRLINDVSLPHCVNAEDAVDPDINYYQGTSWYRTQLDIQNPYTNGLAGDGNLIDNQGSS